MLNLENLLRLFSRYGCTARDILVRPRSFKDNLARDTARRYLNPFEFLGANLLVASGAAFVVGSLLLTGQDLDTLSRLHFWGVLALVTCAWLENIFLVLLAKASAFALGVSATLHDLLDGYCYASILFVVMIPTTEIALIEASTPILVAAVAVQVLFVCYAAVLMSDFVPLHPRYRWRVAAATAVTGVALPLAVGMVIGYYQPTEFERTVLWNIHPEDGRTIAVSNKSREPGCSGCWSDSVNARIGEVISLDIFYHQSAKYVTAIQPRIRLLLPDMVVSSAPLGVVIGAANAPRSLSAAVVVRNDGIGPFRLSVESVQWYVGDPRWGWHPLPYRQTGAELLTDRGLLLEDIPPGQEFRGDLVVQLRCQ